MVERPNEALETVFTVAPARVGPNRAVSVFAAAGVPAEPLPFALAGPCCSPTGKARSESPIPCTAAAEGRVVPPGPPTGSCRRLIQAAAAQPAISTQRHLKGAIPSFRNSGLKLKAMDYNEPITLNEWERVKPYPRRGGRVNVTVVVAGLRGPVSLPSARCARGEPNLATTEITVPQRIFPDLGSRNDDEF